MNITAKQREEIDLATRLLAALGLAGAIPESSDRPDVIVHIDGVRTGIEVTLFHADEHEGAKGSSLRATEERLARQSPGQSYPMWGAPNPNAGLIARITDKIATAAVYDATTYGHLWLLISTGIPKLGAVGSTFAFPAFVDIDELNRSTHESLCSSSLSAVYVHMLLPPALFYWSRERKWHAVTLSGS